MFRCRLHGLFLAFALSAGACGSMTAAQPDGGGSGGNGGAAGAGGGAGDASTATSGLVIDLRPLAPLPLASAGTSLNAGALWIKQIEIDSDQGGSSQMRVNGLAFDATQSDLIVPVPSAPPGLYSLIRITIAKADTGGDWPGEFGGQALSASASGTLATGRAFQIADDQNGSVDLRVAPAQLAPGGTLRALVQVDLSAWLTGLSIDDGSGSSAPIVVGPGGGNDLLDAFTANVLASFRGSFVAGAP